MRSDDELILNSRIGYIINDIIIENIHNSDHDISRDPDKNTAGIAAREALKIMNINQGVSLLISKGI